MYGSPACLSLVIDPSFQHLISLAASSAIIHIYDCSLKKHIYSISVVWGAEGGSERLLQAKYINWEKGFKKNMQKGVDF